jgi:cyclopropane-fatty-acyl-phospholipid synthase
VSVGTRAATPAAATSADDLAGLGTSPAAIARHYDVSDDFFSVWLGPELVYSCAWWDERDAGDDLLRAQHRKVDFFASELRVTGGRVLDVGCGWGAAVNRFVSVHGADAAVGVTLSAAQADWGRTHGVEGVDVRFESWVDHQPEDLYDAIACIEASEHFARDGLDPDEKVTAYRAFFRRCASWLRPGGRLGLQAICLDNVGHRTSLDEQSPITELIRSSIFPESMSPSLSELVLGWETDFRLESFVAHPDHYVRTFQEWGRRLRGGHEAAAAIVGDTTYRTFARYFAASQVLFRLRHQTLYRIVLSRRPEPKRWAAPPRPGGHEPTPRRTASAGAVRAHYDLSNDFYALWLGPTMSYSSALWPDDEESDHDAAQAAKVDYFARELGLDDGRKAHRLLDVGCGWGGQLRQVVDGPGLRRAVGLTLSEHQYDWLLQRPVPRTEVRLESWEDHEPAGPYDAIMTFGAFEHFARDGSTSDERVGAYRAFFSRCFEWLPPGGRLGLETIAHDDAPDTAAPLGRGPLGDFVLELYPESLCPHLCELVLGFEPYFLVRVLRSDGGDFARTTRAWLRALVAESAQADALVGAEVRRRFRTYLAASEVQFRMRTITNYRVVLERRPDVRQ